MELYIFDQDDNFLNILIEDEGLVDTWFKDYQNHLIDEPFVFNVKSNSPLLQHIAEENQVAFYDRDGHLRLVRMKELYEVSTKDGHSIRVKCEPSFLELYDHFIEDKRITNGTAQTALNRALEGSRYIGEVTVELGLATDNFYWIDGIGAVFKILNTWGGALKDTITLDDNNEIIERKLWIVQRLGTDNGLIVEPEYNAEQISRKTLSYVETALWGQGASLETDGGGYTRYITFEDVEWKVSNGDPVDKPLGQKWVGDPQALSEFGYFHNGVRKHRFGHFSNQDYETPEELLWATWNELQERKLKEIIHEATIYEDDKKVSLGDTVTILDRNYNKPIELQSQITGLEYDILDDKEIVIVIGKYIDMNEDPLRKEVDDLKTEVAKPRPTKPIDNSSFPNIKPGTPFAVSATGGAFQTIQLFWDYDNAVYVNDYEVYGSQIADIVPDTQHLLYRGKVSAFSHTVDTDGTWYYYIRAVNTHGTAGDFSNRVQASSARILTKDIVFGSITSDLLANNLDLANKLTQSTFDDITQNLNIIGDVNILNGTTIIQDGVVGTAAIANLAVDRFHLKYGIIENVHIADATIESAKIKSVNADTITVGNLRGIDIYGAQFRSSDGNTRLDITGGNVRLRQSSGNYVHVNPDGLYGYNSSGSLRFRVDSLLVTSAALGTSNSNVYLAASSGREARVVDIKDVPSDGLIGSYTYLPLRAEGFIGNFLDSNTGQAGNNIYLRPELNGEVRVVAGGTTNVYYPLRAADIFGRAFITTTTNAYIGTDDELRVVNKGLTEIYRDVRAAGYYGQHITSDVGFNLYAGTDGEFRVTSRGKSTVNPIVYRPLRADSLYAASLDVNSGTHMYVRPSSSGELRVTREGTTGTYRPVRADLYYGATLDVNGGTHMYVRPSSTGNLRVTTTGTTGSWRPVEALSFIEKSQEKYKQDIELWNKSALDIIRNSNIYQYRWKEDITSGISKLRYGLIIGEGYKTPDEVLTVERTSVNVSALAYLAWKALQEIDTDHRIIKDDVEWLKIENQYLRQKIENLEAMVA